MECSSPPLTTPTHATLLVSIIANMQVNYMLMYFRDSLRFVSQRNCLKLRGL